MWNSTLKNTGESNLNRDWRNKCFNSQNNIGITTPTEINVHYDLTFVKTLNTNTCIEEENMQVLILDIWKQFNRKINKGRSNKGGKKFAIHNILFDLTEYYQHVLEYYKELQLFNCSLH